MASRTVPGAKALGERLTQLRGKRTLQAVANSLHDKGIEVSKSLLHKYEGGRMPSADVLWGLAEIHQVPFASLIDVALGRDLSSHSAGESSAFQPGGADDSTADRVVELQRELAQTRKRLRTANDLASRLFTLTARDADGPHAEGQTTPAPPAKRSRTTRKAG